MWRSNFQYLMMWFVSVIALCVDFRPANCQDPSKDEFVVDPYELFAGEWATIRYLFDARGRLFAISSSTVVLDNWFMLVSDPFTAEVLEIVDDQRSEFAEILAEWKREYDALLIHVSRGALDFKDARTEAAGLRKKAFARLNDVLLPGQMRGIVELHGRQTLVKYGFINTFVSGPGFRYLELQGDQVHQIMKQCDAIREKLERHALRIRDQAVEMFLKSLDDSSREAVLEKWRWVLVDDPPQPELLRFWLADNVRLRNTKNEMSSSDWQSVFLPMRNVPVLEAGLDGSLKARVRETSESMSAVEVWQYSKQFLMRPDIQNVLRLTQTQITTIQRIVADSNSQMLRMDEVHAQELREMDEPNTITLRAKLDALHETQIGEREQLASEFVTQLSAIVSREQKEKLVEVVVEFECNCWGPLEDLINGNLGEILKLSDYQKSRIRRDSKKASAWISDESRQAEEEMIEQFTACLTAQQQDKLDRLIGPTLRFSAGNLQLQLAHLHKR